MSKRTKLTEEISAWPDKEKIRYIVDDLMRKEDDKLKKKTRNRDTKAAQDELDGVDIARLFEMPTVLDDDVRTVDDDGKPDWKNRDEASGKEHHINNEYWISVHLGAAGIRRRKDEKFTDWEDKQPGDKYNPADPIGPYLWREVKCCICQLGYEACKNRGPFELAHDVAVTLDCGDGKQQFAHRACNRAEGVG